MLGEGAHCIDLVSCCEVRKRARGPLCQWGETGSFRAYQPLPPPPRTVCGRQRPGDPPHPSSRQWLAPWQPRSRPGVAAAFPCCPGPHRGATHPAPTRPVRSPSGIYRAHGTQPLPLQGGWPRLLAAPHAGLRAPGTRAAVLYAGGRVDCRRGTGEGGDGWVAEPPAIPSEAVRVEASSGRGLGCQDPGAPGCFDGLWGCVARHLESLETPGCVVTTVSS